MQPENVPLEIYMEGNIVFRQGERTIYAQRMYYDVRTRWARCYRPRSLAGAEILGPDAAEG